MPRGVLVVVLVLFPVSEIALGLVKRSRSGEARSEDRGSMRLIWLSIVLGFVLAPITLAVVNRVVKEEAVLLASLGPAYASYCARTKRFIPCLL